MSTFTLRRAASPAEAGILRRIWAALAAFSADLDLALARSHEVQRLMDLSNATLARRGLRRDGIVQHVMATMPG